MAVFLVQKVIYLFIHLAIRIMGKLVCITLNACCFLKIQITLRRSKYFVRTWLEPSTIWVHKVCIILIAHNYTLAMVFESQRRISMR